MAISIIESLRIDRYEFEVFVNNFNFVGIQSSEKNTTKDDAEKSKNNDSSSSPKYTVNVLLDNVMDVDIHCYTKVENKPQHEDDCSMYYDGVKTDNLFPDIVQNLEQRYIVDEKLICNAQNFCYNIMVGEIENEYSVLKPTVNKGIVCIFACVPRTLITILQKNPLELTFCEDLKNDQVKFGKLSISLSSSMGFTNAIAYHFYEKGYDLHWHVLDKAYEVRNMSGTKIIGDISLRLKLTCHGPETNQVNQIALRSQQPQLQPIFVDGNAFDFPFEKHIIQPPPKMMFDNINSIRAFNPDIRELLHCQRDQQQSGKVKPCLCPCKSLLENVKKILFDDKKQNDLVCTTIATEQCCGQSAWKCPCTKSAPAIIEVHRSSCGQQQSSPETLENSKRGYFSDTDKQCSSVSQTDVFAKTDINPDKCNHVRHHDDLLQRF